MGILDRELSSFRYFNWTFIEERDFDHTPLSV